MVRNSIARLTVVLLIFAAPVGAATDPGHDAAWTWDEVPRVVAIGDVHGAYDPLVRVLEALGLVDGDLAWAGARTHLVMMGDLVDRGPRDRAVMDLVKRLQTEADLAGGKVHLLIGNHEVMNLVRDFRYVSNEGFAEFVDEEDDQDRGSAWTRFRAASPMMELGQRAFNERYPPGYFGRLRAFGLEGKYGAWLMEQPVAIRINGYLFVHGGLTVDAARLGLQGITDRFREDLTEFHRQANTLGESLVGAWSHGELYDLAEEQAARASKRDRSEAAVAARRLLALTDSLSFAPDGPMWHRGFSLENERIERAPLREVLRRLDAKAIVIGHTPTRPGVITSRFNDRVYRVDVGAAYRGKLTALVFENDGVTGFDPFTLARSAPLREEAGGEQWPVGYEELSDPMLERFLERARIVRIHDLDRLGRKFKLVELRKKGLHLRAVFSSADEKTPAGDGKGTTRARSYRHEIAAYELDRLLGLGMVPVTVPRKVGGRPGALQIFLEDAVDLPHLRDRDRFDLIAGMEPQIRRALVFSALIGSTERMDAAKMVLPLRRRIMLADHTLGFPVRADVETILSRELPRIELGPCRPMDPGLELALRTLKRNQVLSELGDDLNVEQIDALLLRRDRILERCGAGGS